jgi:hypothetical protein
MRHLVALVLIPLAGCAELGALLEPVPSAEPAVVEAMAVPVLAPPPPPPPPEARTVEEFDTTTAAEREAAVAAPAPAAEDRLGTTIGSLGSPTIPGIWMVTGLVTAPAMGRVEVAATGKSVTLELRPSGGAPGAGSQVSLAALRLLEVSLTDLPELIVYRLPDDPA